MNSKLTSLKEKPLEGLSFKRTSLRTELSSTNGNLMFSHQEYTVTNNTGTEIELVKDLFDRLPDDFKLPKIVLPATLPKQ